jgi:putative MFS transporter
MLANLRKPVAERLDQHGITGMHVAIVAVCALGFSFDLLEIALGSVLSAVFSAPQQRLDSGTLAVLLASVYVGAVLGAPSLGWVGDRYGRKLALTLMLLWLAPLSVAMAWVRSPVMLVVLRLLSGLSLGAYPAVMMAYLTDILPARRRGMFIFIPTALASLGPPLGLLLVRALTGSAPLGLEGWRWGFLLGGAGAACGGLLFLTLPESPRWLAAVGRPEQAWVAWRRFERSAVLMPAGTSPTAVAVRETRVEEVPLPWRPRYVVLMGAIFLLSACGTSGFTLFSGAVMVQKGIKVSDTVLYLGIATTGQFLGTLLAAVIADRVERRTALTSCAVAMAVVVLGFVLSSTVLALLMTGVAYSILMALYLPALFIYATELFPTARRSSATAFAWTANRVSSALIPFILLPLLRQSGALAMATVIAVALFLAAGLILGCCPRKPAGLPVS